MLPAAVLLFFFLVKPVIETIHLSFFETVKVSENKIEKEMRSLLDNPGAGENRKYQSLKGWGKAILFIAARYNTDIRKESLGPSLTLKDAIEYCVQQIYKEKQKKGDLKKYIGFKNYRRMFSDKSMITAFKNNVLWLVLFTFFTVGLGLVLANLVDKVRFSMFARTVIFIPMAISYVASAVIWAFMFAKGPETGTVNALLHFFSRLGNFITGNGFTSSFKGIAFLGNPDTVNLALIFSGIWIWVGFCMVVFSAALRAIPSRIIEAARMDGASPLKTFIKIEIPMIFPTIAVVATTMVINVLKVFDVVYTMTGGGPFGSSEVVANRMYQEAFKNGSYGYAAAMAVVLLLAVVPVMVLNIKSFTFQERIRE